MDCHHQSANIIENNSRYFQNTTAGKTLTRQNPAEGWFVVKNFSSRMGKLVTQRGHKKFFAHFYFLPLCTFNNCEKLDLPKTLRDNIRVGKAAVCKIRNNITIVKKKVLQDHNVTIVNPTYIQY